MSGRRPVSLTVLVLAALASAGCSIAGSGEEDTAGPAGATGAPADSGTAAPPGDTAVAVSDTTSVRSTRADSALRALRDSARTMQERRSHGADSGRGDTARRAAASRTEPGDGYPHGPVRITDVDSLAALGPVYTPADRGAVLRNGRYLQGLLKAALVPVIQDHDLSPETWARFWVLVDARGRVRAAELHLGSGHAAFDDAARALAERLRYAPARRDGEPVPVWVLVRVSLLMG